MAQLRAVSLRRMLSLEQLTRRFDRLRELQRALIVPESRDFVSCGRKYALPLTAKTAQPCNRIPARVLQYLAGFFDGDGCVFSRKGRCHLSVGQARSSSEVLLLFRNMFGGGIYSKGTSVGMQQSCLQWALYGDSARHAASALCQSSTSKQDQLLAAAKGMHGNCLKAVAALSKLEPEASAACTSWSYMAGFFDAEGSIKVVYPAAVSLQISQKDVFVLYGIQAFLRAEGFSSSIYKDRRWHKLAVCRTAEAKHVLERLLLGGLRAKRKAARICLELMVGNFHKIRSQLLDCVGYQSRYTRSSTAGVERAYKIKKCQASLRNKYGSQSTAPEDLKQQLKEMRDSHAMQSIREKLTLLRADIRLQILLAKSVSSRQASLV